MRTLVLAATVLACLLFAAGLAPSSLSYDELAFLLRAREGRTDYGHALHVPLLGFADALAGPGAPPGTGARLVAPLGAAVALALLWRRLVGGGTPFAAAGLVAGLFAASALPWQQAGTLEPTAWTAAALLAAGEAAVAYGRQPTGGRLALVLAALALALGFHVVSVLAVPWLARLAAAQGSRLPRAHLAGVAAVALALVALAWAGGELGAFLVYWGGFLPRFEDGVVRGVLAHLARAGRLVAEGAPVLAALAVGCALAARGRGGAPQRSAWLALPYALALLALGRPLVGLLVPVLLAAALRIGEAAASAPRPRTAGLALALALTLALGAPQALAWHRAPDVARARAALIARYLPEGRLLFAGPYANHLRLYHPEVGLVDVTELVHHARARDRDADPIEVVRARADAAAQPCVLSSDAAAWLRALGAAPERLGLSLEGAFLVPEEPRLALFPLSD